MELLDELHDVCRTSGYKIVKFVLDQIKTPLSIKKYTQLINSCIKTYKYCNRNIIHEQNIKTIQNHYYHHLNNSFYEFILISYKHRLFNKHIFKQIYAYAQENIFDHDFWAYEDIWKIKDEKLFVQILSPILTHPDYLSDVIDGINTDYILDNKPIFKLFIQMIIDKNLLEYIFSEFAAYIYYEFKVFTALIEILVECNLDLNYEFDREYSDIDGLKFKTWLGRAVFLDKIDHCRVLLDSGAIPNQEMIQKAINGNIYQEIIDLLREKIK